MSDVANAIRSAPDHAALYARLQPNRLALVDLASGRRWSYGAFHDAIQRCVTVLESRGIAQSDRIAVLAKNSADLLILQLASMRLGVIFVPMNWRLANAELAVLVKDCTPTLLVHDEANAEAAAVLDVPVLPVATLTDLVEAAPPASPLPLPSADRPSVLLYTSGTSGKPKGVIITETGMFHNAVNFSALGRVSCNSVFLCESPFFHVIGLITSLRGPLLHGATMLISDGFDPARTIARFADPDLVVTHYFCVPQMANMLRNHPDFAPEKLRGLLALFTGGAPNPAPNIHWWLDQGIRMVDGYGMTETGTTFGMSLEVDIIRRKAGSVGLPAPTVDLRLADDDGRPVPAGMAGEIWLKGPNVTPGYWNQPEATAAAFTEDGWFRTGDLARMDDEGFLSIVDRKKDMFISGGENVYPGEVEAVLHTHPAISEVSVIGVPDERWGEVGRAFLVARGSKEIPLEELAAFCRARLAHYKVPKDFIWLKALPRTASGKIQKHRLAHNV